MTSSPTTPETSTEDETLAILVQRPKVKEVLEMEHLNQISESPFRQISQQSFTVSTPSWPISQVLASQRKSGSQARRIESMLNSKGVISSFAYVVASVRWNIFGLLIFLDCWRITIISCIFFSVWC